MPGAGSPFLYSPPGSFMILTIHPETMSSPQRGYGVRYPPANAILFNGIGIPEAMPPSV